MQDQNKPSESPSSAPTGSAHPSRSEAEIRERVMRVWGSKKGRVVWRWQFEWKLEDFWIGAFWRRMNRAESPWLPDAIEIWICLIPCVPLHLWQEWVAEDAQNVPDQRPAKINEQ